MKKTVNQGWNSETPTFRKETKQEEFMKAIRKEWTGAKIGRKREFNKVRCISRS